MEWKVLILVRKGCKKLESEFGNQLQQFPDFQVPIEKVDAMIYGFTNNSLNFRPGGLSDSTESQP